MYCEFFGLKSLPFNNTPDPRFFFNTPDHEEALASLLYAAQERKGFVMVTGEVGAGKTLLSRMLLARMGTDARTAVLSNTRLTGHELLAAVCREFEVRSDPSATSAELAGALEDMLLEQYARDRLAVLILDEAQNLPPEAFEELRMLGNLEADDAKLLQVLVLGQPELQERFRAPAMRQLYQRMFRNYHLKAMDEGLSAGYIDHRLRVAGLAPGERIFDESSLEAIYRHAEGIPRLINQLCDNAMLAAYTKGTRQIDAELVNEVLGQTIAHCAPTYASRPTGAPGVFPECDPSKLDRSAAPAPISLPVEKGGAYDWLRDIDRTIRRLSERVETAETALERVASAQRQTVKRDREAAVELESFRRLRHELSEASRQSEEQKASLQQHVSELMIAEKAELDAARQTRTQAVKLNEQAEAAVQEIEERASATIQKTEKQNELVQRQVRQALQELHAYTHAQKSGFSRLMAEEKASLESVRQARQQAAALLKEALAASAEAKSAAAAAREQSLRAASGQGDAARHLAELVDQEFAGARSRIEEALQHSYEIVKATRSQSQSLLAELRSEVAAQSQKAQSIWEAAVSQGDTALVTLQAKIAETRRSADHTHAELEQALVNRKSEVARLVEQSSALQQDLAQAVGESRRLMDDARSQAREITRSAATSVDSLKAQVEGLQKDFTTQVTSVRQRLEGRLAEALQQADTIRAQSKAVAGDLAGRITEAREKLQAVIAQAGEATQEVRAGLSQMIGRAGRLQRDLASAGEEIQRTARASTAELEGRLTERHEQLIQLQRQAEATAAQIGQHANELLVRAQATAAGMNEQASNVLNEARDASERQRDRADAAMVRAEDGLRKAHELSETLLREAEAARSEARDDGERIREQVLSARDQLAEARQRADETIRQGEDVARKTQEVLAMPKELIEEATRRAAELAEISRKTAAIVDRLGEAGDHVLQRRRMIDEATESADEKLDLLKRQTARVGQLVGIVRQLYGSMDARAKIERIRARLDQADDICRSVVPREMDNLRSVLAEAALPSTNRGGPSQKGSNLPASRQRAQPPKLTQPAAPGARGQRAAATAQGSLGDMVSRHKKLNEWLRETLSQTQDQPPDQRSIADRTEPHITAKSA